MRYIRYAFLAILAVALISVALANRDFVTLTLLPSGIARIVGMNPSIDLPLFVVIFAGIVAGLLIGFVWEWLREHKHRAEARRNAKEAGKLEREVRRLKGEKHKGKDEVLALIE
ncbi:phosphoribosylanthranilate isomerase [Oceanicola sp. 22II-s10i]|uniref:lipopolysaccharide assembly protein LapA domain-containing protein n=1 Tax=Oceanicola sp. 22II-s10i TaxID=1317116 RepID=UPI000B52403B|nr:LapA family protein [Oceanicola sp. 22II-s10i]OWU85750.1 phosphoribosylanthranilate isomerase [Oceanicola sp. 22II-s10i]